VAFSAKEGDAGHDLSHPLPNLSSKFSLLLRTIDFRIYVSGPNAAS